MAIPRRELRDHKCLGSGAPINSYDFPQAMHPTSQHPIGGSQQPHTAPRTNNQTDRHTRKPNPGTPATGHTAPTPRPPCDDHPTQEHATIGRAPGGTTAAPATQRAHHAHIPSNASPNSVTTRPSLHESHHYHHTHALPSPEDPNTSELNHSLYVLHIPLHRAGPGATGAGQATGTPRPRPHKLYPETPKRRHPPRRA